MLYNHFTEELLVLQGVKITNVEQEENLIIHLEPERKSQNCICCGTATDTIHDYMLQKIKDIPSFGIHPARKVQMNVIIKCCADSFQRVSQSVLIQPKIFAILPIV